MEFLRAESFFDLSTFEHRALFSDTRFVWEGLARISGYLKDHLHGNVFPSIRFKEPMERTAVLWQGEVLWSGFEILDGDVTKGSFRLRIGGEETSEAVVLCAGSVLWDDAIYLGPGCVVEPGALIKGPTIIGRHTEIRQGAYIRGKCLIGDRCVVGHTTEIKSSIMLNDAKAGHFAYIGDSILGHSTNLGAGTKLANLKIEGSSVSIRIEGQSIDTGLRKFGAILGDRVEIGCNAVTNPGVLLGNDCRVFPVTSVFPGYYEPKSTVR